MEFIKKTLFLGTVFAGLAVGWHFFSQDVLGQLLFKKNQTIKSFAKIESSRSLGQLETAQVSMQFLFPYDFIEPPYPNWSLLRLKNVKFYTENDKKHSKFYQDCLHFGYDLAKNSASFFTVTATASAGYDLANHKEAFKMEAGALEEAPSLSIRLPAVQMLYFQVNNEPQPREGWPSPVMKPQVWAALVAYLEPQMRQKALDSGLLTNAQENARAFLYQAFSSQNFSKITIKEETQ